MGAFIDTWYSLKALTLFAIIIAVAMVGRSRQSDRQLDRFGPANWMTTLRLALVAMIAGFIGEPATPENAGFVASVAIVAAALDGLDGWLARRTRLSSAFGARFDMEVDALLILVLAVLAWEYAKAGTWVLLSGLLRYMFLAAGWVWPWMQNRLPPSRRRQAICVVQVVGLIATVSPLLVWQLSRLVAGVALSALSYSFLIDTLWLWRHAEPARQVA